jgi:hypothetical protein
MDGAVVSAASTTWKTTTPRSSAAIGEGGSAATSSGRKPNSWTTPTIESAACERPRSPASNSRGTSASRRRTSWLRPTPRASSVVLYSGLSGRSGLRRILSSAHRWLAGSPAWRFFGSSRSLYSRQMSSVARSHARSRSWPSGRSAIGRSAGRRRSTLLVPPMLTERLSLGEGESRSASVLCGRALYPRVPARSRSSGAGAAQPFTPRHLRGS